MALLTLTQQNNIKPLSPNWCKAPKVAGGKTNFEQLQEEVENKELRKLLGAALLYDIQQNPIDAKYVNLLDGDTYQDCDGNTIEFQGIRFQLSYMNYSKYVGVSNLADTFTGFQVQNRNETTAASDGAKIREQLDAREIALQDFELMEGYLNENDDIYTLWKCTNTKRIYNPKLTTFRKTYN
jgi:hypothetical protein